MELRNINIHTIYYAKVKNMCSFPPFPHMPSPCGACKHVRKSNWPSQCEHAVLAAWSTLVVLYQLPALYFLLAKFFDVAGHLIWSLIEYGAVVEWYETKDSTNDQKAIGATATLRAFLLWNSLGVNMYFCGENPANNRFRFFMFCWPCISV